MVRPVPIPNTAVKHSLADGSGFIDSARVGCRQFLNQKAETLTFRLFCCTSAVLVQWTLTRTTLTEFPISESLRSDPTQVTSRVTGATLAG